MNGERQQMDNQTNTDIVSSNLEFINTHMDDIVTKTNECISLCQNKLTVDSSFPDNKLYISMNNIIDMYYSAQMKLMEKLLNESNSIIKIGERYKDLDEDLSSKAGEL